MTNGQTYRHCDLVVSKRPTRLAPAKLPQRFRLLGPVIVLIVWEAASRLGLLALSTLAVPSTAIATGYDMLLDGSLLPHLVVSAACTCFGLFMGVVAGVILALLSGLLRTGTRTGEALIDGLVQIKRTVPTLALIPLVIILLGIGEAMKVFLIFTAILIPVYINTRAITMRRCLTLISAMSNSHACLD